MCRLKRELYGLKKSPCAWYTKIDNYFTGLGFTKSEENVNLYHIVVDGKLLIIVLYVDDLILTSDDKLIMSCKQDHVREFEMKEMGLLQYFPRIGNLEKIYGAICISGKVCQRYSQEVPHLGHQTHGDSSSRKLEEGGFYFRRSSR